MLVAYVLRLVPSALAEGQLAGTVQFVETGQTTTFRSLEELVAVLLPHQREGEGEGEQPPIIDLREPVEPPARTDTPH